MRVSDIEIENLLSEGADKIAELQDTVSGLKSGLQDIEGEVQFQINAITHPHGQRAHFIDSADQIRVEALEGVIHMIRALSASV